MASASAEADFGFRVEEGWFSKERVGGALASYLA